MFTVGQIVSISGPCYGSPNSLAVITGVRQKPPHLGKRKMYNSYPTMYTVIWLGTDTSGIEAEDRFVPLDENSTAMLALAGVFAGEGDIGLSYKRAMTHVSKYGTTSFGW